jgi:stearoyl-CoA desaturase (delta-9 desaturase)
VTTSSAYIFASLIVFAITYCLNMTYISVFYHRGFTHEAIRMSPGLRQFVIATGSWVTGIDIKSWTCMHRMHHMYSDTQKDPHSPKRWGIFGTLFGQLHSYKKTMRGLLKKIPEYTNLVKDLEFDVSSLNKKAIWYAPYVLHVAISLVLGLGFGMWFMGACYYLGMMSHPVQGWLVNSFGHAVGYRNFETSDDSRNNTFVALTCFGEGYQNNHHRFPKSARFSMKWFEFDLGWVFAKTLASFGLIEILNVVTPEVSNNPDPEVEAQHAW